MKRKITKLWGVGLIVVLLASLVTALPASAAQPLQWNEEGIPTDSNNFLRDDALTDVDITDLAIGGDGLTIYAATGTTQVYKSTDAGITWTNCELTDTAVTLIAVAPDNDELVIAADTATPTIYISVDAGTEWGDLGTPDDTNACVTLNDIDVSAATRYNYVAVCGIDDDGAGEANVWTRALGATGAWTERKTTAITDMAEEFLAVQFSPNYASDEVLTAVTANTTTGDTTDFHMFSMNSELWNSNEASFGDGYPVNIIDEDATAASIALAPTYLGGDPVERVTFIGVNGCTVDETNDGVYRLKNTNDVQLLQEVDVNSVAYDGVTVVAGTDSRIVYRCEDPLVTSPTFFYTTNTKSPGGEGPTVVGYSGTTVVAGTQGDESAFAVSDDNGESFRDISLIDTSIAAIDDIGVAADGSALYLLTNDGDNDFAGTDNNTDLSVWRYDSAWQRVLSIAVTDGASAYDPYIVRLAPEDVDVLYVAEYQGTHIYYTKDGGTSRWYSRTSTLAVNDLAVENSDVAYIGGSGGVKKTTNGGFTWSTTTEDAKVSTVYSLTCISEDMVLAGGTTGKVSYSADGNDSWNLIPKDVGNNAVVTADGLSEGSNIYAGSTGAKGGLDRWTIGQAAAEPWADMKSPQMPPGIPMEVNSPINGILLQEGVLYASTDAHAGAAWAAPGDEVSAVYRNTVPFIPPSAPPGDSIEAGGNAMGATFDRGLRASTTDYSTKLWLVSGGTLYSFDDTLVKVAPELIGPPDGTKVSINPLSGDAYDVNFTWNSVANIQPNNAYGLIIMLDEMGNEQVTPTPDGIEVAGAPGPVTSQLVGPTTTTVTGYVTYMAGTTYYWKVKVINPIHSPDSEVRSFTVEAGAAVVPEIGSPANGGTVTETPAFSWSPVAGATMYQFEMATDTTFGAPIYSKDLAATGIQPDVALDLGTYFWRVRVLSPTPGEWSTIANFTVGEAAPPGGAAAPPVEVTVPKIEIPEITVPPAAAPEVTVQPAEQAISSGLLWAIIIIGAVLVIAVIVLIVRTRRTV